MSELKTRISEGGRLVIPAAYRKALGLKPGDEVVLFLEEGEIRVVSTGQAIARAQAMVRRYVPKSKNLSDEMIRDRREDTARG